MIAGLVVLARAMDRVRSATARRQLRWIIWGTAFGSGPFAIGYALPYTLGLRVSVPMEVSVIPLSLVPLAFASALIRYRLMDVEVIVKRSLVYTAVILAIFTIYQTLFRLANIVFLDAAERHNDDHRHAGDDRCRVAVQPRKECGSERAGPGVLSRSLRLQAGARGFCARSEHRPGPRSPRRAARRAHARHVRRRSNGAAGARRVVRRLRSDSGRRVRRLAGVGGPAPVRNWLPALPQGRRFRSTIPRCRAPTLPRKWRTGASEGCTTSCRACRRAAR